MRELRIEFDKSVRVRTAGLPVCHLGIPDVYTEGCEAALIGDGEETVQVAFAEQGPVEVSTTLQIFNGGERDGEITMFVRGEFGDPIDGTLLGKVTVKRINLGRFGWLAEAKLPQIAGGSGSITNLELAIGRLYKYEGRAASVLTTRCSDGKNIFRVKAIFENGATSEHEQTRPCPRPVGPRQPSSSGPAGKGLPPSFSVITRAPISPSSSEAVRAPPPTE